MAKKLLIPIFIGSAIVAFWFAGSAKTGENAEDSYAMVQAPESKPEPENPEASHVPRLAQSDINRDAEHLEKLRKDFNALWNLSRMPAKSADRENLLARLSADEATIDTARLIITDNDFARRELAEDQAEARIMAIEILENAALQGNIAPLQDSIQRLGHILSRQGSINKGLARDLEDMISAYTRIEAADFFDDSSRYMKVLGCNRQLIDHCANGIYFGLLRKHKKKDVLPLINAAIAGINGTDNNSASPSEG
ncbi:MAG: hypothetical protein M3Q07_19330 [Pseudobdellovibrionaceae bacterium]|nr:hypothetical protein [Pseudobdellovibrionaceae bacterium]